MNINEEASRVRPYFSYLNPATFSAGSAEQKRNLQSIAEDEFDLSHLPSADQELLQEAIQFSGLEVHDTCVVDVEVEGSVGAFLRRFEQQEHRRFDPRQGVLDLTPKEDKGAVPSWRPIVHDYTAYPYPFGDQPLIPKVVPVNLSTIDVHEQRRNSTVYSARPSALLFASEKPENRILTAEDLVVKFSVDTESERLSELSIQLEKPKRVHFAISIKELHIAYQFKFDEAIGSNVLSGMQASMRGRLGLVFNPNFRISTTLHYSDCMESQPKPSYLFDSIDSINSLARVEVP